MLGLSSQFYANPEACAHEVLTQKMALEAQRALQQSVLELPSIKAFLGQGQMMFCVPCGLPGGFPAVPAIPTAPHLQLQPLHLRPSPQCACACACCMLQVTQPAQTQQHLPQQQLSQHTQLQPQPQQQQPPPQIQQLLQPQQPQQSTLQINFKNSTHQTTKPGPEECALGPDGIEIIVDLRGFMPADIHVGIDEQTIDVKAQHTEANVCRTFSRKYDLPVSIVVGLAKCALREDGLLFFSAPWKNNA